MGLDDSVEILLDPDDNYSLAEVREQEMQSRFRPMSQSRYRLFSHTENLWGRVSVQNLLADPVRWSFSFFKFPDSISVYVIRENERIETYKVGIGLQPAERKTGSTVGPDLFEPYPTVTIPIRQNERIDLYFKIYPSVICNCSLIPSISSWEWNAQLQAENFRKYLKIYFYLGIIWMLVLYNFLIYLFYKENAYLFLALYAVCFVMPVDFSPRVLLWENWVDFAPWLVSLRETLLNPLVFVFTPCFIRSYLNSKVNFPKTDRYLIGSFRIGIAYLLASVILVFLSGYSAGEKFAIRFSLAFIAIAIVSIIFLGIVLDLVKYRDSRIKFLLSSLAFVIGFHLLEIGLQLLDQNVLLATLRAPVLPLHLTDFGVLGQITILTLGLGYRSREIAREKNFLEERDRLKSQFFTNISHEFRTPLTLILSPIQQVLASTTDPQKKQLLETAHANATRQMELINQILDLSKLETGKLSLQAGRVDLIPLMKYTLEMFEALAKERGISLSFMAADRSIPIFLDQQKFEKICYNLISNAFQFTPAGGRVSIRITKEGEQAVIAISDTGLGISQDRLPNIFDRFFYSKSAAVEGQEGSGIGLALVKELVLLHRATIRVESTEGKGTTFYLNFPLGQDHLQSHEIRKQLRPAYQGAVTTPLPLLRPNALDRSVPYGMPKPFQLLVIEDQPDVRLFIRQCLEATYQIAEAANGKEGLEKAFETMPDLIISDVMMPVMDGYQLCGQLKTDIRTSHIPVILLTAKAGRDARLEGLDTGADAYITKPFDAEELHIRIRNLIQLRRELRKRFAETIFLQPSEIKSSSLDEAFLQEARAIVEAHISDENFSIDQMAQALRMSRATLNRKLRALLDQSSNDFIKSIRLHRAADLLRQAAGSVSEIAYQTGFRSTSYFVKCFKEHFGKTPGSFGKNNS